MNRVGEALVITLLGLVCLVACLVLLFVKTITLGYRPRNRFSYIIDDVCGSAVMTGFGIAHIFVPVF